MLSGAPRLRDPVAPRNLMRACADDQRSEPRGAADPDRAMLFYRGMTARVDVLNASSRGAMVEGAACPQPGETVVISFADGIPVFATVKWCESGRIGLNFAPRG